MTKLATIDDIIYFFFLRINNTIIKIELFTITNRMFQIILE